MNEKKIVARPYFLAGLARLYDTDKRTFNKWIKPFEKQIGARNAKTFTPKQVQIIFDCIGYP